MITPDSERDPVPEFMTTNQGLRISDNHNSLKAGVRGPTMLEDFVLREKIMHFDHERIPERVVHARGTGAHGFFEVYQPLTDLTCAGFLSDPSIQHGVRAFLNRGRLARFGRYSARCPGIRRQI